MQNGDMREVRIAVPCDGPDSVMRVLAQTLELEFEGRDSAYLGAYWTELPARSIRVLYNKDPLYIAERDPPNEFYFQADFPRHRTLVDIENCEHLGRQVIATLMQCYADSKIVFDRTC